MTGLKSGSGDDLWGDDGDGESDSDDAEPTPPGEEATERRKEPPVEGGSDDDAESSDERGATDTTESAATKNTTDSNPETSISETAATSTEEKSTTESQSYIVRRAVQDRSVQFERDERLTFFVHDDVADGERELITDLESALGRDVPKFDVREAVYRAALQNPDDVLAELLKMGYSLDEE